MLRMFLEGRASRTFLAISVAFLTPMSFSGVDAALAQPVEQQSFMKLGKPLKIDRRMRDYTQKLVHRSLSREHIFGLSPQAVHVERLTARSFDMEALTCGIVTVHRSGGASRPRPFWIWTYFAGPRRGEADVVIAESFKTVQGRSLARGCGFR
ncbi:hypothetical protein [Fulvimarina sp. MAC3]|uniref:hypothetical protein n=1 Tax=Fulvimarina sp. MAC3 TaxID=3148887 RepID=UPI0031FDE936